MGSVNPRSVRILVVEGDSEIRRMVVESLRRHGLDVAHAYSRQDMNRQLARDPSLVIIDLGPAEGEGFELLRMIRSRSDVPIIVTSGYWCDEVDRVLAFELGADDYIMKPYGLRELAARVRAVLRRLGGEYAARRRRSGRGGYKFNGWQVDLRTQQLTDPCGKPVHLTKGEYALLIAFLDAPQRPLTREYLRQATRMHEDIFDRSINVQILRLRRKLEPSPTERHVIKTMHGVGYVFALPVERI